MWGLFYDFYIRFTDENVLKKWIEEMCDSIYKYRKESGQGFFAGIKSYFFSNVYENMEISKIEEVSTKQRIIWEFKGNINIIAFNYLTQINKEVLETKKQNYIVIEKLEQVKAV